MKIGKKYVHTYTVREEEIALPEDRFMDMVKVAFMMVLASWMTGCLMMIVYAKEVAEFIVERSH